MVITEKKKNLTVYFRKMAGALPPTGPFAGKFLPKNGRQTELELMSLIFVFFHLP
jgi:hypothetical protein